MSKYGKVLIYGFDIKKSNLMEDKRKYKAWRSTPVGIPKGTCHQ